MKSKINTKELSHLARLSFSDNELSDFEKDMESIVSFAKKITEAEALPLSAACEGENVLRSDILQKKDCISSAEFAPKGGFEDGFFAVPRVVE